MRITTRLFAAVACVMNIAPAQATVKHSITVLFDLSPEQWAYVEQIACIAPHGVALEEATANSSGHRNDEDMYVQGACASHASFDGFPLQFGVSCRHSGGEWSCEPGKEVLRAKIAGQEVFLAARGVSMREAFDIVKYLLSINAWHTTAAEINHPESLPTLGCEVRASGEVTFIANCGPPIHTVRRLPGGGYEKIRNDVR